MFFMNPLASVKRRVLSFVNFHFYFSVLRLLVCSYDVHKRFEFIMIMIIISFPVTGGGRSLTNNHIYRDKNSYASLH